MYLHLLLYICGLMITNYCGGNVMYTIEATRKALINRFEENNWKELEITLKTGDRVWITPCPIMYGEKVNSVDDIEYFLLASDSINLCGSSNIDDVAETLNNFSQLKEEDENSRIELQRFYEENIAGHSDEEWKLGHELHKMMYENPKYNWETPFSVVAADLANQLGGDANQFEAALRLVENGGTYSDWHKDIYGYRPRW